MGTITDRLQEVVRNSEKEKVSLEQLSKFEDTLKNLQKLITLEKPTYSLPQVDTIGKQIYLSLNKK